MKIINESSLKGEDLELLLDTLENLHSNIKSTMTNDVRVFIKYHPSEGKTFTIKDR
jgi:hypothetical protein